MTESNTAPLNLSIPVLQGAYQSGALTPRGVLRQLRAQALAQADYNAWIHVLSEEELAPYLERLDSLSMAEAPLWGVPFAIKDNIDLAQVPTTAACAEFAYTPERSATVVQRLISAGAIPLGKTNLDQFATGLVGARSPWGEGKNAFNPDYVSGGSSAGSAIATALGQVSFALGTDTAGSGRVPTAFNNLIGHKPTRGLLSNTGVVPACKSLDCVTVMALTTSDTVTVLDVAVGEDDADPYSRANPPINRGAYWRDDLPASFRFGVPNALDFDGDADAAALFDMACRELTAMGGTPMTLDFEPFLAAARLLYEGPWVAERVWATRHVDRTVMLPVIQSVLGTSENFSVTDVYAAQYALAELKKRCDQVLADVDIVVTPTIPTCYTRAALRDDPVALNSRLGTYTNFMNLLDYAATAVPVGALSSGVNWGITCFHDAFSDIRCLRFAGALQRRLNRPMGATGHPLPGLECAARPTPETSVDVLVCGAHLEGQPLNWQLTDRNAHRVLVTQTAPQYALYALPDGKRPAMVQRADGAAIDVEVWRMPMTHFGSFVAGIPAPLGIGKVTLASGEQVSGFICEDGGISGATDITHFGGWRAYIAVRDHS